MLPRRAATKVLVHKKDRGAFVSGIVEGMRLGLSRCVEPLIIKGIFPHPREGDLLQVARREDSVCIDVISPHQNRTASNPGYLSYRTHFISSAVFPHIHDLAIQGGRYNHRRAH